MSMNNEFNDKDYIKHLKMFYPIGIMEDFIDKIDELPECLVIGNKHKKFKNNSLYKYNQNIDFLTKYWFSIYMKKYEPYICQNGDIIWGIKTKKNKKYYFICEPNTIDINKVDIKNKIRINCIVYYYNPINTNESRSKIESYWNEYIIISFGNDNMVTIENIKSKKQFVINIEKLCLGSEPRWRLKQIRTEKSIKQIGIQINCFDLKKMKKRQYNYEYRFDFSHKKFYPRSPKLRQHMIYWLTNKMIQNPFNYIEYNNIKKTNHYYYIKETPELAFPYHDKKNQNKLTQLIKTEADDINKVYYIIGIENKNDSAFLKFGAQYIFMMNNNEIKNRFYWYFKQNNIVLNSDNNNDDNKNDDCKYDYDTEKDDDYKNKHEILEKHYNELMKQHDEVTTFNKLLLHILYEQIYLQSIVLNVTQNPGYVSLSDNFIDNNINNNIKNNDIKKKNDDTKMNELDEFNQEILLHKKLFENSKLQLKNIVTTTINHDNKDSDNNIVYYGAFCLKHPVNISSIKEIKEICIAPNMKHALQGLIDTFNINISYKAYIIKCALNKNILDANRNNGYVDDIIKIEGKEINKLLQQRQIIF